MKSSTILLEKDVINELKKSKDYPRQTYSELLKKMSAIYKHNKERNQYDEFLHKIQQMKMKELWGNREDEEWESV